MQLVCVSSWPWCPEHPIRETFLLIQWGIKTTMDDVKLVLVHCLDRKMRRRCWSLTARPGAALVELGPEGTTGSRKGRAQCCGSMAVRRPRLCIVHGATHVIPTEPKYSFRKRTDQMSYYYCSQCCAQSTTIHQGARCSPTEKSLTHFYRRARFSPLVCISTP